MFDAEAEEAARAESAKNAKILHRKQIEKRLQGLRAEEYQKIVSNLENQNERLHK